MPPLPFSRHHTHHLPRTTHHSPPTTSPCPLPPLIATPPHHPLPPHLGHAWDHLPATFLLLCWLFLWWAAAWDVSRSASPSPRSVPSDHGGTKERKRRQRTVSPGALCSPKPHHGERRRATSWRQCRAVDVELSAAENGGTLAFTPRKRRHASFSRCATCSHAPRTCAHPAPSLLLQAHTRAAQAAPRSLPNCSPQGTTCAHLHHSASIDYLPRVWALAAGKGLAARCAAPAPSLGINATLASWNLLASRAPPPPPLSWTDWAGAGQTDLCVPVFGVPLVDLWLRACTPFAAEGCAAAAAT